MGPFAICCYLLSATFFVAAKENDFRLRGSYAVEKVESQATYKKAATIKKAPQAKIGKNKDIMNDCEKVFKFASIAKGRTEEQYDMNQELEIVNKKLKEIEEARNGKHDVEEEVKINRKDAGPSTETKIIEPKDFFYQSVTEMEAAAASAERCANKGSRYFTSTALDDRWFEALVFLENKCAGLMLWASEDGMELGEPVQAEWFAKLHEVLGLLGDVYASTRKEIDTLLDEVHISEEEIKNTPQRGNNLNLSVMHNFDHGAS